MLLLSLPASADFALQQTDEVWPGKIQVAFHPAGFQITYGGGAFSPTAWYRVSADFSYLVMTLAQNFDLWVGAQLAYAVASESFSIPSKDCTQENPNCMNMTTIQTQGSISSELQISPFAMLTLNLFRIPLVPFVRVGAALDLFIGNGNNGGGGLRLGGGVGYWILKNLAVSLETDFEFGVRGSDTVLGSAFYGAWNFGLGARAGF